jgi:digeranylgeranylglycerophospholipid reductase
MEGGPSDVAVVGGGPAGSSLALALASKGFEVSLLEEHSAVGSPAHCAGLVGPGILDLPGVGPIVRRTTLNELRGAVFVSPGGRRFQVENPRRSALVVDRKMLDHGLGEAAAREGTRMMLRSRAIGLDGGELRFQVGSTEERMKSRVIVGATGSRFALASMLGDRSGNVIPGVQYEVTKLSLDEEMASIYLGGSVSQGLFGWVIPIDGETARVGLCSRKAARNSLNRFLDKRVAGDFGRGKVVEVNAGAIAYGLRRRTVWGNVLLVGDEALQTKPTTGGGIHYSAMCSMMAAEAIAGHLREGTPLAAYERQWRDVLEGEIRFGLLVRRIYEALSDRDIEGLFQVPDARALKALSAADFDRHSSLSRSALALLPRILRKLGPGAVARLASEALLSAAESPHEYL